MKVRPVGYPKPPMGIQDSVDMSKYGGYTVFVESTQSEEELQQEVTDCLIKKGISIEEFGFNLVACPAPSFGITCTDQVIELIRQMPGVLSVNEDFPKGEIHFIPIED